MKIEIQILEVDVRYFWLLLLLVGCTDAGWDATVGKLNVAANIKCWSGGKLIYEGRSTGAIRSPESSDGYQFREVKTGDFMEVSGNCVIEYDD